MSMWEFANPKRFIAATTPIVPWVMALALATLAVGLVWGFFFTPDDFRQGSTVKIFYVHVPAAMMAINIWGMMVVASVIWLVRRHHVSALAARAAAPIGIAMTLIALFTGAVWGQPMWGTWWAWDPRLTSFLILFLFYLGYAALWEAVEDPDTAADLTSILCLVGSVFAFLSRFAVQFWNQGLHQAESISVWEWAFNTIARFAAFVWNSITGQAEIEVAVREENVADVFFLPALVCIAGFILLFVALVLIRTQTEIRTRRIKAIEARMRR